MKQKYNGFTLIELMVSVALMLIIIGMTMVIFNSTSTTFTVAEAKVDIMQNARLALDTIAKDIANATDIWGTLDKATLSLTLITVTNWIENSSSVTGKAQVTYYISKAKQFDEKILYYLNRRIFKVTGQTIDASGKITYSLANITDNDSALAEYLVAPNCTVDELKAPFYFEYFIHSGSKDQNWNEGKRPQTDNSTKQFYFKQELPPLVRITITITDEYMNACRTLSRMIWIPKGIRRTENATTE